LLRADRELDKVEGLAALEFADTKARQRIVKNLNIPAA
jgi:hypothetical protein